MRIRVLFQLAWRAVFALAQQLVENFVDAATDLLRDGFNNLDLIAARVASGRAFAAGRAARAAG